MKTLDRVDLGFNPQNSAMQVFGAQELAHEQMNAYADRVLKGNGYCNARLFGVIFFGEPIDMPFSEDRIRNRSAKHSKIFADTNVVDALHRASLIPRVAGQLFTTDTEMFPKDYSNVGLVLRGDSVLNDRGVRYRVREVTGGLGLLGEVSFSSISTRTGSDYLTDQEVTLLQVGRDYKSNETRVVPPVDEKTGRQLPVPVISLGDHAVRKMYGLSHLTTIENQELQRRRAELENYSKGY